MKKRKMKIIRESGKVRLELVPGAALREEAKALDLGNKKDGRSRFNWRDHQVVLGDQAGGILRHMAAFMEGQDMDPGSLVHHLGFVRARAGIMLDAIAHGTLMDDRVIGPRRRPKKRGRA